MTAQRTKETEEMIALYNDQKQSTVTIGKRYGIHPTLVARRLKRAGVPLRKQGPQAPIDRPGAEELNHVYNERNLTQEQGAAAYGVPVNVFKHWLAVAGVTKVKQTNEGCDAPEPGSLVGTLPDLDELRRLYVDEHMSDPQIGAVYGVPPQQIKRLRRKAKLVGIRANERANSMDKFVEEAKARVVELDKVKPMAPADKETFTAEEAAPYLCKSRELPTEKLHAVKAIITRVVEYKHTVARQAVQW